MENLKNQKRVRAKKDKKELLDRMLPFRINGIDVENYFKIKNKYAKIIVADKTRAFFRKLVNEAVSNNDVSLAFDDEKFNQELEEFKKEKFINLIV